MIAFPRTELAQQLLAALRGRDLLGDAHNGLFLAAPRRTGKTTFLQGDLQPVLEAAGVVVVYVDLWADMQRDPGVLIAEAIGRALEPQLGLVARMATKGGLAAVKVGGLTVDTSRIGKVDGLTLVDALRVLHEAAGKPVALIIDEAQHALTSEAGEAAMTALKSARDQLNRPGLVNLMLQAFEQFAHRPQFFMAALGQVLSPLSGVVGRFEPALLAAANDMQRQDEAQMQANYLGLRPLEQAVLWRMLAQGASFRPYDSEALRFYRDKTGLPVNVAQTQRALEALRQRTPALVWKSARAEYAVEDVTMNRWYEARVAAGTWPPEG